MVSAMRRALCAVGAGVLVAATVFWAAPSSKAAEICGPEPGHTADAKVILKDRAFQPANVTLSRAGMSICWEHQDPNIGHTITSDAAPGQPDHFRFPLDSPPCDNEADADCFNFGDQPWKLVPNTPGTYPYHCELHPDMKGVITVQGSAATTAPPGATTTRPPTATTARPTGTTVGTLSTSTSTTSGGLLDESATTSSSSSSSSSTTSTTRESAIQVEDDDDDDEPSGVLKAVGVVLLLAVIAGLIPAWRQLT